MRCLIGALFGAAFIWAVWLIATGGFGMFKKK